MDECKRRALLADKSPAPITLNCYVDPLKNLDDMEDEELDTYVKCVQVNLIVCMGNIIT